jgi:hypothetical protein
MSSLSCVSRLEIGEGPTPTNAPGRNNVVKRAITFIDDESLFAAMAISAEVRASRRLTCVSRCAMRTCN